MACASLFDRIMTEARIRLPGAIDEVMKVELFALMDEWFRTAQLWQESIALGVVTTKKTYELDSNEWVATINELLYVVNKDQIPIDASMEQAGVLDLYNFPSEDQTYTVRVALSIADALDDDGYPQVPQWIVIKYRAAFIDGLLGRMMSQPAKPYNNEMMAKYHMARFRNSMSSAYADWKQKNTFNTQTWRFPQSFATSRRQ